MLSCSSLHPIHRSRSRRQQMDSALLPGCRMLTMISITVRVSRYRANTSRVLAIIYANLSKIVSIKLILLFRAHHLSATSQAEIHKTGAPCNLTSAPTYSAYGCGGSPALISAAVEAAANATQVLGWPELDFVLFTGDYARHNAPTKEDTLEDIRIVNQLFRNNFPNTTLVNLPTLDLGNNDFYPDYYVNVTSHKPCLPTVSENGSVVSYPEATNEWLKIIAEQQSDTFVDELEKATFSCGGYLIRELSPSLSIIVLNTVIWTLGYKSASPQPSDPEDMSDPFGQFQWLETQLNDIRNKGKKVYVTGHIPPSECYLLHLFV